MAEFWRILNLALSSPLYFHTRMFNPFKGAFPESKKAEPRYEGVPPEFSLWGKSPGFYYRYFAEPERFYRGLIVDRRL